MNGANKFIITIFLGIILLLGAAVYFGLSAIKISKQNNGQTTQPFKQTGNIFKDGPGFTPGVWYLSYEEPGKPGLSVELKLSDQNLDLQVGQRAHVEGSELGGVVTVRTFEILNAYKNNLIWVGGPLPNETVINPITLYGAAKGSWYFEASFPIKVLDANGKVLGQTAAEAQGDWTSSEYVPFVASLQYSAPATPTGTLILEKDNPSGLPENADQLSLPIVFGTEGRAVTLYYYDPTKDKDVAGNIMCTRQGLVPVQRQIPITITPIQDTIKLLLEGRITEEEKARGVTSEYPLPGFALKSADVDGTTLTLEFQDLQNKTGGGSCRVGILWFQIEATAKQFPGIKEVKFKPAELFQP
jgi:hypothetical protein